MGLKITLSEFSQQELIQNINKPWFQELLYVLNNAGSCAENNYLASSKRPLTEMEYQSLNGMFRQGCIATVQAIFTLAQPATKAPTEELKSWGELQPETPNPKAVYTKSEKPTE